MPCAQLCALPRSAQIGAGFGSGGSGPGSGPGSGGAGSGSVGGAGGSGGIGPGPGTGGSIVVLVISVISALGLQPVMGAGGFGEREVVVHARRGDRVAHGGQRLL